MKLGQRTTLSMSVLAILLFVAILSFQKRPFWNNQVEPSQQVLPQNYQAFLPNKSDNPFGRYGIDGTNVFSYGQNMQSVQLPTMLSDLESQIEQSVQEAGEERIKQ
jgi:hypothetical protein